MSQHIGRISKSDDVRVLQELNRDGVDQSVDEIEDSRRVDVAQRAGADPEVDELLRDAEELLAALAAHQTGDGEPVDVEVSDSDGRPVDTPIDEALVRRAVERMEESTAPTARLRTAVTDLGTATSIVTGGLTMAQLSDPGMGVTAAIILFMTGALSAPQVRDLLSRVRSALT